MDGIGIADAQTRWDALQWEQDPPAAEWDRALAALGGHPLQSCLWGDARQAVDGIIQHRWLARRDGEPIWMIRVEERRILGGRVAWAPRGPSGRTAELNLSVPPGFEERLKAEGFSLLVCDPWVSIGDTFVNVSATSASAKPQLMWIDLSQGRDAVFKNLHENKRNDVRRAARAGVRVEMTRDPRRIGEFADLCFNISQEKGFELRVTSVLIDALLSNKSSSEHVEAELFVALKDGKLGSGLIALRVGQNVSQLHCSTDREMRSARVGEACHWGAIEWALARGSMRYDLDGIDPAHNRSVYEFKKHLGGKEITLPGHIHRPLNLAGRAMSWLIRHRR